MRTTGALIACAGALFLSNLYEHRARCIRFALLMISDTARAHPAFAGVDGFRADCYTVFVLARIAMAITTGLLTARQAQRWMPRFAFAPDACGWNVHNRQRLCAGALSDVALLILAFVASALVALAKPLSPMLGGAIAR